MSKLCFTISVTVLYWMGWPVVGWTGLFFVVLDLINWFGDRLRRKIKGVSKHRDEAL